MISPYVRRQRLAREIVELRGDMTHAELRKRSGVSQSAISRLENGRSRPNVGDVIKILDVLAVDTERWEQVVKIAYEAAQRGWWESEDIDDRQAMYADLEAGAATIREYQLTFVPGLLQTPGYTRARAEYAPPMGRKRIELDALIRARAGRQRMFRRPGGPTYEVILDELAIRRATATPDVLSDQFRCLADLKDDRITLRILPMQATIELFNVPQSAFSLYTYKDPGDPEIVAVDTVTSDLILTEPGEVEPYKRLYDRLRKAALSTADSSEMLREAADRMEEKP